MKTGRTDPREIWWRGELTLSAAEEGTVFLMIHGNVDPPGP
jgi:hypothetical protein